MSVGVDYEWNDPSLKRFEEVANMEVDDIPHESARASRNAIYLVLDTNILLAHLEIIQEFVRVIEEHNIPNPVCVIIPGIVVKELDGQKKNGNIGWAARRASTWILQALLRHHAVRGQSFRETLQESGRWNVRDKGSSNDDLVVDCALYYRQHLSVNVGVVSEDRNLCTTCMAQGLVVLCPKDGHHRFSNKTLALWLFGEREEVMRLFPDKSAKGTLEMVQWHDEMEVDDDDSGIESKELPPSHQLDMLHQQIVVHFRPILLDLVRRVSPQLFERREERTGSTASIHNPISKNPEKWNMKECVEHLAGQARTVLLGRGNDAAGENMQTIRHGAACLGAFLCHRSERGVASRRGQEWSREDWMGCLKVLKSFGETWRDEGILFSLQALGPVLDETFAIRMRPTGT